MTTAVEEAFRAAWERARPHLEAALVGGGSFYTLDEVAARIAKGDAFLMAGANSAGVFEFWDYPDTKQRALHVWLAGGDLQELTGPMQADLEVIARENGCTDMLVSGRRGWERALATAGYAPGWQIIRKVL